MHKVKKIYEIYNNENFQFTTKKKNAFFTKYSFKSTRKKEGDARSALITIVQVLNHSKNGDDIVSSIRVRSYDLI